MRTLGVFIISLSFFFCSPRGPQTYDNPFIGKTKDDLISSKGIAKEIKIFDKAEAYIYKTREEYFGKIKDSKKNLDTLTPKKVFVIEHIYYINEKGIIYKYQVWKKRIN